MRGELSWQGALLLQPQRRGLLEQVKSQTLCHAHGKGVREVWREAPLERHLAPSSTSATILKKKPKPTNRAKKTHTWKYSGRGWMCPGALSQLILAPGKGQPSTGADPWAFLVVQTSMCKGCETRTHHPLPKAEGFPGTKHKHQGTLGVFGCFYLFFSIKRGAV